MLVSHNSVRDVLLYSVIGVSNIETSQFEQDLRIDFPHVFSYYHKTSGEIKQVDISVDNSLKLFNFSRIGDQIFKKNHNFLKYVHQKDKRFLADLFASFSEMLMSNSNYTAETILNSWVAYLYILEKSHIRIKQNIISEELNNVKLLNKTIILFVAGAQNYQNLRNRVNACYLIFKHLYAKNIRFQIILSGRNNQRYNNDRVEMPNESWFMKNLFLELCGGANLPLDLIAPQIYLEHDSNNSTQNIEFFLKKVEGNRKDKLLFIVSSTNHIYRLFETYNFYLETNNLINDNFNKIYLVGSETPSRTYPTDHNYYKQLILEILAETIILD
jgi:hypothetical protein